MLDHVHILIVEDSQTQATEIKYFLEESGYRISVCYDGVEAWDFLQGKKIPPSLVISDIVMPNMNGYELCEKIRQHEKFSDVMVMLLTALSEPTDIIKGLKSQADSFLIKPYNKNFLLGRIGHLLEYQNFIKEMPTDMGLAIDYFGQRHFLTHNRVQVINNLISVRETVETQSHELKRALEAEKKLKESEERLIVAGKAAYDLIYEWDVKNDSLLWFGDIDKLLGYGKGEISRDVKAWLDLIHPEDRGRLENAVALHKSSTEPIQYEYRVRHKNGTDRYWNDHGLPIFDENGSLRKWVGVCTDITERKQSETEIQESEKRYRLLADNVSDNLWIFDLETLNFSYVSPSVIGITGFTSEEATGFQLEDVLTPPSLELANKILAEELTAANQNFNPTRSRAFELEQYHKSGSTVWTEVSVQFIYDHKKQPSAILGVTRDISERKRLQSKLIKSQKMESLGLLAGGVAHDLNNVLSGIVSYPELILIDLPEDSKLRKPLQTMMESGHRAVAIVQDLLTVARGVAMVREPLRLNELVSEYLNSPEYNSLKQLYPTVTVKTHFDTDLLNILASYAHVRKVVLNLVVNASEAIKGIGNITISTENRYVDKPLRGYDEVSIGEYAVLSISDDGPGIPPNDFDRIFEPFYTKKVMGRSGTGLGLAAVWNVIQDHKGYIDVRTDDNGTSFELYFPVTREELWKRKDPLSIISYKGNGETILVIDDEKSQREISCKILETLGYNSTAVSSGEEAVEYLKKNNVDLLLLDMIMDPGINGRETYEKILKIHPSQKAIIVSGFSETNDVKNTQKLGAGKYIKKPLTIEKIGLAVKEELEK